jgi:cytochrome b
MSQHTLKVWDPLVRIFHWSLVVCFTVAFLTGEEETPWHIYMGYAVMGLVLFRILWGFVGPEHARFKSFLFGPSKAIQYLKSLTSGSPQDYVGHNPLGGYMVVLMLVTLLLVTVTGLKAYGVEGHGPLASHTTTPVIFLAHAEKITDPENKVSESHPKKGDDYWEELHEAASNFMLGLALFHILMVFVYDKLHHKHLVRAMITGKKHID